MKGIIINLLEDFVSKKFGDETLEEIYEKVKLSEGVPPFIGPINYPDEDIFNMLSFLSEKTGSSTEDLFHTFGKYVLPVLAEKYPVFFESTKSAKEFLKTVNDIIHIEVKKLYDDVSPPVVILEETDDGQTLLHYKSKRKLCDFLKGLIDGAAEKFGEKISYQQIQCMKQGDDECIFELIFNQE